MASASPAAMLATLPEKTGRSVEEWIAVLEASGAGSGTHTQQREWLMSHGLGRNHSGAVLWWRRTAPRSRPAATRWSTRCTRAGASALRPVYEALVASVRALGDDVEVLPRETYVTFARGNQFAIAKPGAGRVDVGLRLLGVEPAGRLADAGSFGSGSITHKLSLHEAAELDDEVRAQLRAADDARG